MSWFSIETIYDFISGQTIDKYVIDTMLTRYEYEISQFENILIIPRKYDVVIHIASAIVAIMVEKSVAKNFSYLRAGVIYFSIYGYITAFVINKTIKGVADLLLQLIEHAKSKQI